MANGTIPSSLKRDDQVIHGSPLSLQKYEEAIIFYEQIIHLNPNFAKAYAYKGLALAYLGRHEEAIQIYEEAIRLEPESSIVHENKGNSLKALKRYEEAIHAYEEAIRLDPYNAGAYWNKGAILIHLGNLKGAEAISKAIKLYTNT